LTATAPTATAAGQEPAAVAAPCRRTQGKPPMSGRLKTGLLFVLDVLELYLPMAAFLTIFVSFIIQIIWRYFLVPLMWPEELSLLAFLWAALLGALYAKRHNSMVAFSMLYDAVGPTGQLYMRVAGNALIVAAIALSVLPTLDYVLFQSFKRSSVLRIPMHLAYSVYMLFLVDIIIRYLLDLVADLRVLVRGRHA
jgi:TRAP-type C4-dicarboxylate transport system permease small subunit